MLARGLGRHVRRLARAAHTDHYGVPITVGSQEAALAYEAAVEELLQHRPQARTSATNAVRADPEFAMGHALVGLLSALPLGAVTARHRNPVLEHSLLRSEASPVPITSRESVHVYALHAVAGGRLRAAAAAWEGLLSVMPHDLLALRCAVDAYARLGDHVNARDVVARTIPFWSPHEPQFDALLAMHAQGLVETGMLEEAENAASRALQLNPDCAAALHALAHVMEGQSRYSEAISLFKERRDDWAESTLAPHLYCHWALLLCEVGGYETALGLLDRHVGREQPGDLAEASAVLWRLQLLDEGALVGDRWVALAEAWTTVAADSPSALVDVHMAYCWAAIGDVASLEAKAASMCSPPPMPSAPAGPAAPPLTEDPIWFSFPPLGAPDADDDAPDDAFVARAVGAPVVRALLALAQRQYGAAAELLMRARPHLGLLGGSSATAEMLTNTLIHCVVQNGDYQLARLLLSERTALRPGNAQYWMVYARILGELDNEHGANLAKRQAINLGLGHGYDMKF